MKNVVINNKTVEIKPINFAAICELEELGFDVKKVGSKTFSSIRSAVAYHMGITLEQASVEIESHFKSGGSVDDIVPLLDAIVESDFFDSLARKAKSK